jgi:hypothetical protein
MHKNLPMHIKIFIVVCFVIVCSSYKCANKCVYNITLQSCVPHDSLTPNDCNPIVLNVCPRGCVRNDTLNVCIDDIDIDPIYSHYGPYTDTQCVNNGNLCSCKCKFDVPTNSCIPSSNAEFCNVQHYKKCPTRCSYVNNKCVSTTYKRKCSTVGKISSCHEEPVYTSCLTTITTCNDVCGSHSCLFDPTQDDRRLICFPTTKATCPYGYVFFQNVPWCNDLNRNVICRLGNHIIQYPDTLAYLGDSYKCNYFEQMNCELMNKTISGCPLQCQLDDLRNKCVPRYRDIICGSFELDSPVIGINNTLECDDIDNQMLINISDTNNKIVTKCGPIWYYAQGNINYIDSDASFIFFSISFLIVCISFLLII